MKSEIPETFFNDALFLPDAESLRFAINAAGLGVWEVDTANHNLIWDHRCRELFGLANDNPLTYEEAMQHIHPDDLSGVNAQMQAALRGQNNGAYNATYRTIGADDGKLRWVAFSGTAYFDQEGHVARFGGVAHDLTDSHNQQQKNLQFQQQITTLLAQSSVAIAINIRQGLTFTAANSFYGELVGRRPEDIIGKPLSEALPELEGKGFDELLYGVLNTGVPYFAKEAPVELVRGGKRETIYVNFAYNPLYEEDGTISSTLTVVSDVTPQVKARQNSQVDEARFRSLVEEALVAMFIFRGENMVINTANKMALAMIGRTEDVVGKPLLEAIPELSGSPAYRVFQEVYHTGQAQYGREVLVPLERAGVLEDRYFNFAYTPLLENGQVVGVMDVASEVTDLVLARKKIEDVVAYRTKELAEANRSLSEANIELQRSNRSLEEFAHAASHDLKEPVRKIHFFTTRLKDQLEEKITKEQAFSFSRISSAAERMGMLIDDLLVYSHVSQRPHQKEAIDLNISLTNVLEDLELDIQEKKARIDVDVLPVLQGYRRQLQQLFQNLLSNALKYSQAAVVPRITITAAVAALHERRYHCIKVSDNGIGFDQEYAERIFQMFARLHGKGEYSGTGVGLSIVRKIVENHDGFIEVESQKGTGSVFSVYLPATE